MSVFDNTGDYLCHFGSDANFDGGLLELAIDSFELLFLIRIQTKSACLIADLS